MKREEDVRSIVNALKQLYPDALCSLQYDKDYELLFAVRLSAQCTDERVNKVTPALFERFPTLEAFAEADPAEVAKYIHSCGFFNGKSRDLVGCAQMLLRDYGGKVPSEMEDLLKLPGVGRKSAQRLAFYMLDRPEEDARAFAQAILDAKTSIHCCPVCQNLTEGDGPCAICASPRRDHSLICVVADPKDVIAMERAGEYQGLYHVLHGVISPMNHVGPDDLRIKELVARVAAGGVEEVIMATNPDTEGETTAMYLSRLLRDFGVKITRLAYGIPVGSHLEFADDATLMRALEGRRDI